MRVHSLELACRLSGSSTTRLDAPPLSWSLGYWTSVPTSQYTPLFQLWVDYSSTKSSIRQNLMLPKANLYQLHIYTSYWGGDRLLLAYDRTNRANFLVEDRDQNSNKLPNSGQYVLLVGSIKLFKTCSNSSRDYPEPVTLFSPQFLS